MLMWWLRVQAVMHDAGREEGQGLTEYALIIALIAILLVAGLIAFRGVLESAYQDIAASIPG